MDLQQQMLAAVTAGDLAAVETLLQGEPGLASVRDSNGVSMLLNALYHRQTEMAVFLGQRLERLSRFEAAALGDSEALGPVTKDAGENFSSDGFTPLHLAAFFGREAATVRLIQRGADVEAPARNAMRVRPIHSAAAGGNEACVGALLAAGADPNSRQAGGYTPLMAAAAAGNREMVAMLLAAGADKTLTTEDSRQAADLARAAGHKSLATEL